MVTSLLLVLAATSRAPDPPGVEEVSAAAAPDDRVTDTAGPPTERENPDATVETTAAEGAAPREPEPKASAATARAGADPTAAPPSRWMASGPWVPQSWPVQQSCAMDHRSAPTCVLLRGDVFTGARVGTIGGQRGSDFRLDRAELGSGFSWRPARRLHAGAVVGIEAIRSAGPQSLTGIDGDSLVLRVLEAYGHGALRAGPFDLGVRAGVVPERWLEQVEKGYDTRGLEPIGSDGARLFERADVGATATASGWRGRVELDLELVNGEGRAQRELNRGKNTTAIVTVRPVLREHARGPIVVALHGGFRDGSLGIASAADRRGAAAVTLASPWVYAGAEYVHALGVQGRSERRANVVSSWVSGRILPRWLGAAAKYDRMQQDLTRRGTAVHGISVALFSDVFEHVDRNRRRLRLYLGYRHERYGAAAAPLPGVPAASSSHRLIVQLELRGLARIRSKETS